jgi:hypothetical protein
MRISKRIINLRLLAAVIILQQQNVSKLALE